MTTTSRIDFTQPLDGQAARLRQAFGRPRQLLLAHTHADVRAVLDAVHAAAQRGHWCVGYLRYEAAAAFDTALQTHAADGPLAWFAVHDAPMPWPDDNLQQRAADPARVEWADGPERAAFDAALARIQQAISAGELYQVNYTAPLRGRLQGAAEALFAALQQAQPGGYAAHIVAGDEQLLSVSPELFFDWHDAPGGGRIVARPMKGTAPRGATPGQDMANAEWLRTAPKERAENVMIVDLLRNDMARIALPHSVRVPVLFATQALPTVWQMTSDVQARTRPGTTLTDVFAALFPCGSVTGAPKVRAMQMIRQLEPAPRGVYCGAVGVVRPRGPAGADGLRAVAATFNVPIRTVVLHTQGGQQRVHCGIGSGITCGAQADAEWREWQYKRAFVERASMPFELLETLALEDAAFRHLPEHLARLRGAAAHFGVPWDADAVQQCLRALAQRHLAQRWRVRLLLDAAGRPRAEAFALHAASEPVRLALATRAFTAAHSEFVRYKTTRRAHYAAFAPTAPGVFDTLLWNEAGEITESTFGNIAAYIDGRWVTPPCCCGLLPGVGRAVALREGRVAEAVLRLTDRPRVQGWAFINSLRGWLAATVQ
ncbi:chorismate-binding protein [Verminephrobacter eiseniae]|uniref:Para-aminobenzoate synthase, subunit I n=1 Tax=Verminephrobacter eiseniae (strain EF01-2) TaxID=391735 RepID=A1WLR6_VEREI|nr:chorismate-binding protein [Verminephrobacter eiseniae]ABM58573.1 para-aminobenzoate synthase, subunit I [Verminephrobacter eiseniae EF01-2]MCW5284148.1 bifunctional aminodeoxychorismate synthase component I/aminotransferase [Verminephrobacter eiseniae]MCW5301856.1 bifunctional aminodeoxychorismate synthase component I/aminotransferase [Verminephrobacter eiseniae]MCW8179442.1 bifunctional aminodeoxychorismate synthase component I/aminotransferase [Verminephrobacter eiseniae]MCW8189626.1 bif